MKRVTVKVVKTGRQGLVMRWWCPKQRKQREKAAGTTDKRKAVEQAAELQAQLNAGLYIEPSRLAWESFRDAYETRKLEFMADKTAISADTALNSFEKLVKPGWLADVDADAIGFFQQKLFELKKSPATVGCYLRHLKAALHWAKGQGMMATVPKIEMPKRQPGMRGRPIDEAEFQAMLAAVPRIRRNDAPAWDRLLRGLWLSGLRIGEALCLSWGVDGPAIVDCSSALPVLKFRPEGHKANRDERCPITPDFADFLLTTAVAEREGCVFPIVPDQFEAQTHNWAGRIVSAIGEAAGVVVNSRVGKYATAHDLRRSFGTRWARRVPAGTLQRLMRHESVQTTLKYYVAHEADQLTAELYQTFSVPTARQPTA